MVRTDGGQHGSRDADYGRPVAHCGQNLSPFFRFGTYRWTCGLVGADVVKIPGLSEKPGNNGDISGARREHSLLCIRANNRDTFMGPNRS